jgi:four helix bundle protein
MTSHTDYRTGPYANHLSVARGSLKEVETLSEIAHRLSALSGTSHDEIQALCTEISKMLTALKRHVGR